MREIQQAIGGFVADRPVMAENNTFHQVVELLKGEVEELVEAHPNGNNKEIAQEMADILFFSLTLANLLGVDAESELWEKLAFNMTRYTAGEFQEGDYLESRERCREWVSRNNWKQTFYDI